MAVQEDDELVLDEALEDAGATEVEGEPEGEATNKGAGGDEGGEEEQELVFNDEAAPASGEGESSVIRALRERNRELAKENAGLRKSTPQEQPVEIGEKPTLESCEYDEDRLERELLAWHDRKAEADRRKSEQDKAQREANESWQRELQGHAEKRAALKFADVREAEETAAASLNDIQQAVIVRAAENSALVLYALGRNPAKLAEISRIEDPLKLAAAVARMEGKLSVMPKRRAPEPEQIANGSASVARATDKQLERLEKEAQRTGDYTKVFAYKRGLKSKAA